MALIREDNLQLTLHSSASHKLYPANRPNCFTTKLCKNLEFGGNDEWEVALMNIQYPVNWPNVLESTEVAFIVSLPKRYHLDVFAPPFVVGANYGTAEQKEKWLTVYRNYMERFPTAIRPNFDNHFEMFVWHYMHFGEEDIQGGQRLDYSYLSFCTVPKGHYNSIVEVGEYIQKRFTELIKPMNAKFAQQQVPGYSLEFSYDRFARKARFTSSGVSPVYIMAKTDYLMNSLFGFKTKSTPKMFFEELPETMMYLYETPTESTRPSALEHLSSLCVYSDINKSQIIGDTEAPLLGIVPILSQSSGAMHILTRAIGGGAAGAIGAGEDSNLHEELHRTPGETQFYTFNPPYYLGVTKNSFNTILIEVRTDWGDYFPFNDDPNSRVVCQLDFRRKSSSGGGGGGYRGTARFLL